MTNGESSFGSNINVTGGANSAGNNTGLFSYVLNPTSAGGVSSKNKRSELTAGQSLSWPTSCPSQVHCSGGNDVVTSTDGSTTLAITRKVSGSAPSGGTLGLQSAHVAWSNSVQGIVVALMQADGNFVAFDAAGNQVWTSRTSGHPGAFLRVGPSEVSVLVPPETSIWTTSGPPWFLVHNEVKMRPGATVTALWRSNDTHLDLFATGNDGAVWSISWEAARGW